MLVDSYGSPTATQDLQKFHDTFFPSLPDPKFTQVFPYGKPDYKNVAKGNGQSGPIAAVIEVPHRLQNAASDMICLP